MERQAQVEELPERQELLAAQQLASMAPLRVAMQVLVAVRPEEQKQLQELELESYHQSTHFSSGLQVEFWLPPL